MHVEEDQMPKSKTASEKDGDTKHVVIITKIILIIFVIRTDE